MSSPVFSSTNAALTPAAPPDLEALLREVVERLAPLERRAGSAGERAAAEWIAERLTAAGSPAVVEEESFHDGYARLMSRLTALATAGGLLALTRRGRRAGALTAAAAAALIADDASNLARPVRRASPAKTTWNVVGQAGDPSAARTLVLLAHHDAAPTGKIFDQSFQHWLLGTFPGIGERIDTALPVWWSVLGGPALAALGGATGRRGLAAGGGVLCALATAAFLDIARSPVVPGANDNLTAVAALVALAERLEERPVSGLRVMLVSCGAEEVLQGGIYGFARRHLSGLDTETTWVLNLDTLGSPELILLEGEGAVIMEDYPDRGFRDLVGRCAERAGVPLRRGMRARSSTDAVVPSRRSFATATLSSMDRHKVLSNYHLPSDTPENVHWATTAGAVAVCDALIRELASVTDVTQAAP